MWGPSTCECSETTALVYDFPNEDANDEWESRNVSIISTLNACMSNLLTDIVIMCLLLLYRDILSSIFNTTKKPSKVVLIRFRVNLSNLSQKTQTLVLICLFRQFPTKLNLCTQSYIYYIF